jgi:O-antigen biosynthesis protein
MHKRARIDSLDGIRQWRDGRYLPDPQTGVLRRPGVATLRYSDGDATEDRLLTILRQAKDLSVLSDELRAAIVDWPTEYHLSPVRANLLRHLPIAPGETVLELGAGCGALTRWLGETGATIIAVEGSERRAAIARERCRDLANVSVVCDQIAGVDAPGADWVLLVGVLEYANAYHDGPGDGVDALLKHARHLVASGGALIVAIENQLGLKYFNGCSEDHLGVPYFGVSGLYRSDGPVTFGKGELDRRIESAGFASRECFLPFPDYKLPLVMLTQEALAEPALDVADLVSRASSRDYGGSTWRAFSEALAWAPLIRNGLLAEHANSFLIVARAQRAARRGPGIEALAWSYSSTRPSRYHVATTFVREGDGIVVRKKRLLAATTDSGSFAQEIADAPLLSGTLLSRTMLRHAEAGDEHALLRSALPWLDLLLAAAGKAANGAPEASPGMLPDNYVDAIPGNMIIDARGHAQAFDLEWRSLTPVAFEWVLLRGIALAMRGLVNSPLRGTRSVEDLAQALLALRDRQLSPQAPEICEAWETRFYTQVVEVGVPAQSPLPARRLREPLRGDLDGAMPALRQMHGELVLQRAERERLDADTVVLREMVAAERASHESSIAKLRSIDATAHSAATAMHGDIETLRATLAAEKAMHAENIEKLRELDARGHAASQEAARLQVACDDAGALLREVRAVHATDLDRLRERETELLQGKEALARALHDLEAERAIVARAERELASLREELASVTAIVSSIRGELAVSLAAREAVAGELAISMAARDAIAGELAISVAAREAAAGDLARARARIDAQVTELAWLHQERSTFGAKAGRQLTKLRNRWFPASTRRGRAVTLACQFAAAVVTEGLGGAMQRTFRFLRSRGPIPPGGDDMSPAGTRSAGPLPNGGTATPPELARWIAAHEPDDAQLAAQRASARQWQHRPLISFIIPVYKVPTNILAAALDSLAAQTYDHWEACVACAEPATSENWQLLCARAAQDARIRPLLLSSNDGISGNSNQSLAQARGEFVALLDHDDALSPSALHAIVDRLNRDPDLDFIYTDKDSIDESGQHRQYALFKPEFSPEMLCSVNYLTHLNVMRRAIVEAIGGWRPETDGAQDWDLFYRFTEHTSRIARVPGLHYHWRIIATSTATGLAAKPYAAAAQLRCQRDRLDRLRWNATALPDDECGFRILWTAPPEPNVELIVHADGAVPLRACLDSLRFARLDDVASIRVLASADCPDYTDAARDFEAVWGVRVRFEQSPAPLSDRLRAHALQAGPAIVVLVDARARFVAPEAVESVARWVAGATPIAWAAGLALAPGDVVREAGRVATPDGTSAPLFRGVPLRSWGWFGGPLWHRNSAAASPILFAVRRVDLAAVAPADGLPFTQWWTRACIAWRGNARRGLVVPYARAWLDVEVDSGPLAFDERFRDDPYFHPAFCSVSPLHLVP